jgi:LuxR family transcriptional regulator, maltose regulon positive regulatory protein
MTAVAHRVIGKRVRPRVSGLVLRPRLFRRLDVRQPLTWVWGPPGSGKTTLVASYLAARRIRSLWYRLDAGDADVAAFLHDLTRDGGRRRAQPLRAHAGPPAILARTSLRTLYDRLARPFVLALDNYDEVPPDAALHEVVREAVMQLPPGGRIIVTSRALPPAAFARLRASRAIAEVGWEDLRLSATETRRLVRKAAGRLPARLAAVLHARAEGWAAGLVLALQERHPFADERRGVPDGIADYLATEILDRVDADTRDMLLRTAVLPRVTIAMAEALTGRPGAGRALVELHRLNCFIVEHPGPETVYQYTSIFRAFLLRRAHAVFPPEQRRAVQRQAASLLAQEGRIETAGTLLRAALDWDGLADLVEAHAATLAARRQVHTVGEWLSAIPDDVVSARAWLLYWRGRCCMTKNPAGSRDAFEAALRQFREAGDATGALLAWAGGVQTFPLDHHEYSGLDAWIASLEDLLRQFPAFPSHEVEARVASSMLVALLYRQPHLREIKVWAHRALELARMTADPSIQLESTLHVLAYRLSIGDFETARSLAAELRILAAAPDALAVDRIAAALAIGRLEWLTGDFVSARATLEGGLGLARSSGVSLFTHRVLGEAALATLSESNRASARRWLSELRRETSPQRRGDSASYRLLVGWDALLAGDVSRAIGEHEAAVTAARECGMPALECLAHLFAAQALDSARTPGAAVHLAVASDIAQQMDSAILTFTAQLIEAHLAVGRGDEGRAIQALAQALPIGRDRRYINTWMWRPAAMAELVTRALDTDLEVEYVRQLIRQRRLEPSEPPVHLETWPWPVKVFTLGRFQVLIDERAVRFPGKVQKKPLALLQALVALGGRHVPEAQLAESLWPDSDGDAAHRALSVTVHRLRRLLGYEAAILRRDSHIGLAPSLCWVDVWAVEQTLALAEAAIARSPVRDHEWVASIRWTDRAVALYRGEFLGDLRLPWASGVGVRLRDHLLRQLRRIGRVWEAIEDWEAAAECYERAITINGGAEDAYRRLMLAYLRLDRRGDAMQVYQRCRTALAGLGVTPSAETETLVNTL